MARRSKKSKGSGLPMRVQRGWFIPTEVPTGYVADPIAIFAFVRERAKIHVNHQLSDVPVSPQAVQQALLGKAWEHWRGVLRHEHRALYLESSTSDQKSLVFQPGNIGLDPVLVGELMDTYSLLYRHAGSSMPSMLSALHLDNVQDPADRECMQRAFKLACAGAIRIERTYKAITTLLGASASPSAVAEAAPFIRARMQDTYDRRYNRVSRYMDSYLSDNPERDPDWECMCKKDDYGRRMRDALSVLNKMDQVLLPTSLLKPVTVRGNHTFQVP